MALPTVIYETYNLPSFTLSTGTVSTNFIRSRFDYGTRQRRAVRGYDAYNVRVVIQSAVDLTSWELLWSDLNDGNDKFYTDETLNGDTSASKIVRFTSGYTIRDITVGKFEITIPIEIIQTGA